MHLNKTRASSRHKTKQAGPTALPAWLTCQPACLVSLPALSAYLICFVPATRACFLK